MVNDLGKRLAPAIPNRPGQRPSVSRYVPISNKFHEKIQSVQGGCGAAAGYRGTRGAAIVVAYFLRGSRSGGSFLMFMRRAALAS